MIQFDYNAFTRNFSPYAHTYWMPVAKTGLGFILAGLLILLLKELLIAIISAAAIGIGIYILIIAWRIYRLNREF